MPSSCWRWRRHEGSTWRERLSTVSCFLEDTEDFLHGAGIFVSAMTGGHDQLGCRCFEVAAGVRHHAITARCERHVPPPVADDAVSGDPRCEWQRIEWLQQRMLGGKGINAGELAA